MFVILSLAKDPTNIDRELISFKQLYFTDYGTGFFALLKMTANLVRIQINRNSFHFLQTTKHI
jgi:hypothetical protein